MGVTVVRVLVVRVAVVILLNEGSGSEGSGSNMIIPVVNLTVVTVENWSESKASD